MPILCWSAIACKGLVEPFLEDPRTIAVGGTIRIANGCQVSGGFLERAGLPTNWWALFQVIEYLRAFLFGRIGWSPVNGLLIVSGAFGLFNKEIVVSVGGYNTDTIGEDMELTMRLHRTMTERRASLTESHSLPILFAGRKPRKTIRPSAASGSGGRTASVIASR